jgi:hypothetical protein
MRVLHSLPAAPGTACIYTHAPEAAIQADRSHKNAEIMEDEVYKSRADWVRSTVLPARFTLHWDPSA